MIEASIKSAFHPEGSPPGCMHDLMLAYSAASKNAVARGPRHVVQQPASDPGGARQRVSRQRSSKFLGPQRISGQAQPGKSASFWLGKYPDAGSSVNTPLAGCWIVPGVDEDSPVFLVQLRIVSAVIEAGPSGLLSEQEVPHVGLLNPGPGLSGIDRPTLVRSFRSRSRPSKAIIRPS